MLGLNADTRFNDDLRAVISSVDDPRLTTLITFFGWYRIKNEGGSWKMKTTTDI